MSKLLLMLLIVLLIPVRLGSQTVQTEPETIRPGSRAPDFNLPGVDGKMYTLKSFEKAPVLVIIFSCNHCPTAQAYEDRIIAIEKEYGSKGVALVMISPNADKQARKADALRFLQKQQASNMNFIFNDDDVYKLIEAVDPDWQGALPFTMLIEPGGNIIYKKQDMIDPYALKKLIVDNKYIGRYY